MAWLEAIADDMRQTDIDEVAASSGLSPLDALLGSVTASSSGYVVTDRDDKPVMIFGAAPHGAPGVGVVWMLATNGLQREAFHIAKQTRRYLAALHEQFTVLFNWIDDRNKPSMKWLEWGGFQVVDIDFNHGAEGRLFYQFVRHKDV